MTKHGFGKRLALGGILLLAANSLVAAQQSDEPQKAGKPINVGDVLSGELSALHLRAMKPGEQAYQITSEPRRLPPPNGLCDLVTGPETFQLVPASSAQAAQLKSLSGKEISVKVGEVACAEDAGQISEAIITKWSLERH